MCPFQRRAPAGRGELQFLESARMTPAELGSSFILPTVFKVVWREWS